MESYPLSQLIRTHHLFTQKCNVAWRQVRYRVVTIFMIPMLLFTEPSRYPLWCNSMPNCITTISHYAFMESRIFTEFQKMKNQRKVEMNPEILSKWCGVVLSGRDIRSADAAGETKTWKILNYVPYLWFSLSRSWKKSGKETQASEVISHQMKAISLPGITDKKLLAAWAGW